MHFALFVSRAPPQYGHLARRWRQQPGVDEGADFGEHSAAQGGAPVGEGAAVEHATKAASSQTGAIHFDSTKLMYRESK